jgi:16S rRNA (guanine(1405)-N(7))-methyltransferase
MKKRYSLADDSFTSDLVARLTALRKYKDVGIPEQTLLDLVEKATLTHSDPKKVEDIVRQKLHNLVAPYLGDPDYAKLLDSLRDLPPELGSTEVRQFCLQVLNAHSSTRERIPIDEEFYRGIFSFTGTPRTIMDVACGLNPFALPWMHLQSDTRYLAYDLHQPRVDLINAFFTHVGQNGSAILQDILVDPPQVPTDVVFFFKEAHRFEQREHGCNRSFLRKLPAKYILLSLPTVSLTGRRSMLDQDRRLVEAACDGQGWQVSELLFDSEIVFCIRKEA